MIQQLALKVKLKTITKQKKKLKSQCPTLRSDHIIKLAEEFYLGRKKRKSEIER